jgi:curved DNA-binding protein
VPERDLYEILGVQRGASEAEIKKTYRRLARQYHPDMNPGNRQAEERFKEITAAFEVLSDHKRRKLYDEFGPDALRTGFDEKRAEEVRRWRRHAGGGGGGRAPFDFGDFSSVDVGEFGSFDFGTIFGDIFGRGGARAGPAQAANLEAGISVTLRDAVLGAERDVRLDGRTLRVRIPAGIADGAQIRLAGQGGPAGRGTRPGDLLLKVNLQDHPHFRREGKDLYVDLPVTVPEAALGAEVRLPTFEGPVRLQVPPGASSGTKLRLRSKGVPDLRGGPRGDLYAVVQIVLPPRGAALEKAVKPRADLYAGDPRAGISV